MKKAPLTEEEEERRFERVIRHPTRWQLKKLVLELQSILARLEPWIEKMEAEDEQQILKLRVLRGGAIKRTENKTLKTCDKIGL
jgi:hypothetical protein